MQETKHPLEDIRLIRQMMEESSRFLSLSGLSGISAGIIALIGAGITYFFILDTGNLKYTEYIRVLSTGHSATLRWQLGITVLLVLFSAITAAWYFTWKKSRKQNQKFWTSSAKRMTESLLIVLVTGGVFCIILFAQGYYKLIASTMLIFYGLALLHASRYSHRDIVYLAYTEILIGIVSAIYLNWGLLFWTIGFGVMHIIYGTIMYYKYDKIKTSHQ
jgi:MFS family permease